MFEAAAASLRNYLSGDALETATGVWLIFGWLWYPALLWVFRDCPRWLWRPYDGSLGRANAPGLPTAPARRTSGPRWRFVNASLVPVTLLMLGAHFGLGRIQEIRISFLLAPWIIAVGLAAISQTAESYRSGSWTRPRVVMLAGVLLWVGVLVNVHALRSLKWSYWRLGAFGYRPWTGLILVQGGLLVGVILILWLVQRACCPGAPRPSEESPERRGQSELHPRG